MGPLSASDLRDAFQQLSEVPARYKVTADVYVVGGAAMALGLDSQRLTQDLDVFIPTGHA